MTDADKKRIASILQIPIGEAEKIFLIQSKEVQAVLVQREAERIEARLKPVPKEAQRVKEDGSVDLNVRPISEGEHDNYQGLRLHRGERFEEVRQAYLTSMAAVSKIHESLKDKVETPKVAPKEEARENAIKGFMGMLSVKAIKERFMDMMSHLFKPTHAEHVAKEIRKNTHEE